MKKVLSGLLLLLGLFVAQLPAQTLGTPGPSTNPLGWGMNNLFYSNRIFNVMMANSMLEKGAKPGSRPNSAKPDSIDYTAFRQAPGILLTKSLTGKVNDQNRQPLEQIITSSVNLYRQTAQKDNFPANDLAYAFEYFVVNNYQLYHDLIDLPIDKDPYLKRAKDGFDRITLAGRKRTEQVSIYQERAVYQQFKQFLAANPEIQKMTDAQKQEATELLAVMFGVNFAGYMKGINDNDDKLTEQARQMAKDGLEKLLNTPAGQIKITAKGVE